MKGKEGTTILEGSVTVSHGSLLLDGLDLVDELGYALELARGEHGAVADTQFGRVRVTVERLG
jgi:hypothetical protein